MRELSEPEVEDLVSKKGSLGFLSPRYQDFCITNLPTTLLYSFGIHQNGRPIIPDKVLLSLLEEVKKVVLLVVDSLGYRQLKRLVKDDSQGSLRWFLKNSHTIPLSSTFPSTTTTGLASLCTGLTPQEHGIVGYTVYLKEMGIVANLIHFSPALADETGVLERFGIDPSRFIRKKTIHEVLAEEGIDSCVVTRSVYKDSAFSRMVQKSSNVIPYMNSSDLCVLIRKLLEKGQDKEAFILAYWDMVDLTSHVYGPYSEEASAELRNFTYSLKTELFDAFDKNKAKKSLLLVTSDHGQSEISKPILVQEHKRLLNDLVVPPIGDSRAAFLHVRTGRVDQVMGYLRQRFKGMLDVVRSEEVVKSGMLGTGRANRALMNQLGDITVLPRPGYAFAYSYKVRKKEFTLKGSHGGVSEDEMLVPLISIRLDSIER